MTRFLVIGLLAGCGGASAPPPASSADAAPPTAEDGTTAEAVVVPTIDERIVRASDLLTTNNPDAAREALVDLERLLQEAPDRIEVVYNAALAYQQSGDFNNAKRYYFKATQLKPGLGRAWLNLGGITESMGDSAGALRQYRSGVAALLSAKRAAEAAEAGSVPELSDGSVVTNSVCSATVNQCLGAAVVRVLYAMGRHDEAVREAKMMLKHSTDNVEIYNTLGLVYLDMGKPDLAFFFLTQARDSVDGAKNNATLHSNLGRVELARGNNDVARGEFEKAIDLNSDHVPARLFLAGLMMDDRDWNAAALILERARELEPKNPAIFVNLGICYRGLKRYPESGKAYEDALALDPGNPDPLLNLALLRGYHQKPNDLEGGIASIEDYSRRGGRDQERASKILGELKEKVAQREQQRIDDAEWAAEEARAEQEAKDAEAYRLQLEREEQERQRQEQERQRAAEEAARQEAAAVPVPAAQPQPADTTVPAPVQPVPQQSAPASDPWNATPPEPAAAPPPAAAPLPAAEPPPAAAPPPATEPPPPAAPLPAAEPPPPAAPVVRGSRQVGAPCDDTSQCVAGASCVDFVCASSEAPAAPAPPPQPEVGTRQAGAPCASDTECAPGLGCTAGACTDSNSTGSQAGEGIW